MTQELWSFSELADAAGGVAEGTPSRPLTGFSIDTRALQAGDVFVALKDQRDGHEFVPNAFAAGAGAALVSHAYQRKPGDGALIRLADTLEGLRKAGCAARARLHADARVVAVTGSVGKTTTKEMFRTVCSALAATHASDRSFNNHWGVPLTLARMPASTRYAVFEIGMNHAGEITPLTAMVRPHAAIVTTVESAHIENFTNEEGIADAKAEIFSGLVEGGTAVINLDNRHAARLVRTARVQGARILGFTALQNPGEAARAFEADGVVSLRSCRMGPASSDLTVERAGGRGPLSFTLGCVGMHMVMNALIVIASLDELGEAEIAKGLAALRTFGPPAGRGSRHRLKDGAGELLLIDESYNANPASVRAALAVLPTLPRATYPRRIAVLGDMLELGPDSPALHAGLWDAVDAAGTDLVFAAGPGMAHLFARIPEARRGAWAETSAELESVLMATVRAGDVIVVKGSNGSRMGRLVETIKAGFEPAGV